MAFDLDAAVSRIVAQAQQQKATAGKDGSTVITSPPDTTENGIKVIDGDTVVDAEGRVIRMKGGNAPEIPKTVTNADGAITKIEAGQPGGLAAKAATLALMQGGSVASTDGTDAYGRTVGTMVDAEGRPVAKTLAEANLSNDMAGFTDPVAEKAKITYLARGLSPAGESWRDPRIETQRRQAEAEREQALSPSVSELPDHKPNPRGTVARAALRGLDMVSSMTGGFVEALGEATGVDTAAEYGRRVRELNTARMSVNAARVNSVFDVDSAGKAGTYALEKIIENAPNMGVSAGAGILASGAAALFGGPVTLAGAAGTILASYVLNTGEIQGNLKQIDPKTKTGGTALAFGVPAAALDAAPLIHAGRVVSEGVKAVGVKGVAKEVGKGALIGMRDEMPTEAAQEFNSDLAAKMLFGDQYDVFTEANVKKWIDAGVAGGISGAGMGAAAHAAGIAKDRAFGVPSVPTPDAGNPTSGPAPASAQAASPNATVPEPASQHEAQLANVLNPSTGADTMSVPATAENQQGIVAKAVAAGATAVPVGSPTGEVEPTILLSTRPEKIQAAQQAGAGITQAQMDQLLFDTPAEQAGKTTADDAVAVRGVDASGVPVKERLTPLDQVDATKARVSALTGDPAPSVVDPQTVLLQRGQSVELKPGPSRVTSSATPDEQAALAAKLGPRPSTQTQEAANGLQTQEGQKEALLGSSAAVKTALNYLDESRPERSSQPLGPNAVPDPAALEHAFDQVRKARNATSLDGIQDPDVRARAAQALQSRFPAATLADSIAQARTHLATPLRIGAAEQGTAEPAAQAQQREALNAVLDPVRPATQPLSVNGVAYQRVLPAFLAAHFGVDNNPILATPVRGASTVLDALRAVDALPVHPKAAADVAQVNTALQQVLAAPLQAEPQDAAGGPKTVAEALTAAQRGTAWDVATLSNLYTQALHGVPGGRQFAQAFAGRRIEFHGFGSVNDPTQAALRRLSVSRDGRGSNTVGRALEQALGHLATGQAAPASTLTTQGLSDEGQVHSGATNLQDAFAKPNQVAVQGVKALMRHITQGLGLSVPTLEFGPEHLTPAEREAVVTGRLPSQYDPTRNTLFLSPSTIDALKAWTKQGDRGIQALQNLFHELGHAVFEQTVDWFQTHHPEQLAALDAAWQASGDPSPFKEWVAEQVGSWLARQQGKQADRLAMTLSAKAGAVVARIASKIKALYERMRAALGATLGVEPAVDQFMLSVQERIKSAAAPAETTAPKTTPLETPVDARSAAKTAMREAGQSPSLEADLRTEAARRGPGEVSMAAPDLSAPAAPAAPAAPVKKPAAPSRPAASIERIRAAEESRIRELRAETQHLSSAEVAEALTVARRVLAQMDGDTLAPVQKSQRLWVEALTREWQSRGSPDRAGRTTDKPKAPALDPLATRPSVPSDLLALTGGNEADARAFIGIQRRIGDAVAGAEQRGRTDQAEHAIASRLSLGGRAARFLTSINYYNTLTRLIAQLGPDSDVAKSLKSGLDPLHAAIARWAQVEAAHQDTVRDIRQSIREVARNLRGLEGQKLPRDPVAKQAIRDAVAADRERIDRLKRDLASERTQHQAQQVKAARPLAVPLYELRHSSDFRNQGIAPAREQSAELRADEALPDAERDDFIFEGDDAQRNETGVDRVLSQDELVEMANQSPSLFTAESVLSDVEAGILTPEAGNELLHTMAGFDLAALEEGGYGEIATEGLTEQNLPTMLERFHARLDGLFRPSDSVRWYTSRRGRENGTFGKQPALRSNGGLSQQEALETLSFLRREYPETPFVLRESQQNPGKYLIAERVTGATIGAAIRSALMAGRSQVVEGKTFLIDVFSRTRGDYVTRVMSAPALMRAIYAEVSDPEDHYADAPLQRFVDAWQMAVGSGLLTAQTTDATGQVVPRYRLSSLDVKAVDGEAIIVGEVQGTPVALGERKGALNALTADKARTSALQERLAAVGKVRAAMDEEWAFNRAAKLAHPGTAAESLVGQFEHWVSQLRALPESQQMMGRLDAITHLQDAEQTLGVKLADVIRTHPRNASVRQVNGADVWLSGYGRVDSVAEALEVALRQAPPVPEAVREDYAESQRQLSDLTARLRAAMAVHAQADIEALGDRIYLLNDHIARLGSGLRIDPLSQFGVGEAYKDASGKTKIHLAAQLKKTMANALESLGLPVDSTRTAYEMSRQLLEEEQRVAAELRARGVETRIGLDDITVETAQGESAGVGDVGTLDEQKDEEYANRLLAARAPGAVAGPASVVQTAPQVQTLFTSDETFNRLADLAKRALTHIKLPVNIRLVNESGLATIMERVSQELAEAQQAKLRIAAQPAAPDQTARLGAVISRIRALTAFHDQLTAQASRPGKGWILFSNSEWVDLRTPVIFVSDQVKGEMNATRVLAHELGHLVTHEVIDRFPDAKAELAKALNAGSALDTEEALAKQFERYLVKAAKNAPDSPLGRFFSALRTQLEALWTWLTKEAGLHDSYEKFVSAVMGLAPVASLEGTSLYTRNLAAAVDEFQSRLSPYIERRGSQTEQFGFGNEELDHLVGSGVRGTGQFLSRMHNAVLSAGRFGHLVSSIEANTFDVGRVFGAVWNSVVRSYGQRVNNIAQRGSTSAAYLRDTFARLYGVQHAEGHRTMAEWHRGVMGVMNARFVELQKLAAKDNPNTWVDNVAWWRGARGPKKVFGVFEEGNPSPIAEFETRREAWAERGRLYQQDRKHRRVGTIETQAYRNQVDAVLRQTPLSVLEARNVNGQNDLAIAAVKTIRDLYDLAAKPVDQGGLNMKLDAFRDRLPMVVDTGELLRSRTAFVSLLENAAGLNTEEAEGLVRALLDSDGVVLGLDSRIYQDSRNYGAVLALLESASSDAKVMDQLMPFLSRDLPGLVYHFSHSLIKRGVADQLYGGETSGRWSPTAKLFGMIDADPLLTDDERVFMKSKVYPAIMGRLGMSSFSPQMRRLYSVMMVYQNVRLLGLATLSSLVDVGVIAYRGGLMNTYKGTVDMMRSADRHRVVQAIQRLGIISDNITDTIMSDALNSQYLLPGASKFSDNWFRFIGLTQWTEMTRTMATSTGLEVLRELHDIVNGSASPEHKASAERRVRDLQLSPETLAAFFQNPNATLPELLESAAYGERFSAVGAALNQFVDEAVLRPNVGDRPGWANYPIAGLVWHLKQFMWLFHERVLNQVWHEMAHTERKGLARAMPAVMLTAFLLPMAAVGYGLRRLLMGDWDKFSKMSEKDLAFELFQRGGLPGVLQVWLDADQAASHKKLALLSAMGPTATQLGDFFTDDFKSWLSHAIPGVANSGYLRKQFTSL